MSKPITQSVYYKNYKIQYYLEGEGELLLFLHGWPVNATLWESQVAFFKKKHRILTFDWLGFGASDHPVNNGYTFTQQKEILDILLDKVLDENETITIIGHDIGGPPAVLWTHANEARVKRLILLNTVLYTFSTPLDKMSHLLFKIPIYNDLITSPFGLRLVMQTIAKSRGKALRKQFKTILARNKHIEKQVKLKTILQPLEQAKKEEFNYLTDRYNALQVDRYIIMAKHDPLCYAHIKKLSEENPDVPHFLIENCGHYLALEKPGELNEILTSILNQERI